MLTPDRRRSSALTALNCRCGKVHLELSGQPIIVAECQCNSCRAGAARLAALPNGMSVTEPNGGTHYVLQRKDRVSFKAGADQFAEFRLKPDSSTRRVVAACCNTALFAEFQHGHWLSIYGALWPAGERPAAECRTMVGDLPPGTDLPDDIPNYKSQSGGFFLKLLLAWVAMGFRTPKIAVTRQLTA